MIRIFDARHELGSVLIGHRSAFRKAAGFSFAINLLVLVPSIYMLQVYDRVLNSRNVTTLVMLTLIVLVLYAVMGALESVRARLLTRIGVDIDERLSSRVFTAAFERNLRRQGGNPAQALQDLSTVRQFLAGAGALALFDAPWMPIYLLVITLFHPWLGVFSLVAASVLVALAWLNELLTHKPIEEASNNAIAAHVYANNNLRNTEVIEAMGMLPALRGRWAERQAKARSLQVLASDRGGSIGAIGRAIRVAFQSLILGLGAWLAVDGQITPGGMIAASILMGRALAPVEQLIGAWKLWIPVQAAQGRLIELLSRYPAPPPAISLPPPTGAITLENVSAVPPGGQVPVLRNLAIRIHAGDVVGVVGPSASGKSSLARLLVGVWPPSAGHVRLDSADVYTWAKEELGPHIGYLPQDIGMFEGTVAENIARFGPLDSERITAAARQAGVHDMILHLPLGYNTPIGTDGGSLSGGQRQRIALARALYGEPRLVVLDEPNSGLDQEGEAALIQAIADIKARGATVVFVSHGSRLLVAADKLLALRDGALVAYGPRDQVIAHLQGPQTVAAIEPTPAGGSEA